MKIATFEYSRTILEPNTDWEYIEMVHRGEPWLYRSPLYSPKEKITGKRFVNSEFTSDWVQYK